MTPTAISTAKMTTMTTTMMIVESVGLLTEERKWKSPHYPDTGSKVVLSGTRGFFANPQGPNS
jgi:hypothetical protein